MGDAVDDILRLVADGRLTPEEAAPILDALTAADRASRGSTTGPAAPGAPGAGGTGGPSGSSGPSGPSATSTPNRIRVQVRENGRVVVDLQVPGILAGLAGSLPGIPTGYADRVREAIRTGLRGPIVDIRDEDDSGLTITLD
ncbi:MAG TPA: hypothetical protein VF302_03605 [Candidatus Limnocylindrales bacterium]|jgi:hypothetical protein